MYRVTKEQKEKAAVQCRKIKDFKSLIKMKVVNGINAENQKIFPKAKRILTVVRSGVEAQQIWAITEEANHIFGLFLPLAFFDSANVKRLKQFCSGRLLIFIHASLYKTHDLLGH